MSLKIPADPTPQTCWEELRPLCNEILRMCRTAPLEPMAQAGLMTMAATHFYGAAMAEAERGSPTGRPLSAWARDIMNIIVEDLEKGERPKVVSS